VLGYLFRRLLLAIFVLWGVASVIFLIVRVVPADPALLIAGTDATPEQLALLREQLGLNAPLIAQYGQFLFGIVTGDLGDSYTLRVPAASLIASVLPNTALLALLACAVALIIAFPLGLLAALKVNGVADRIVTVGTLFTQALPNFWIGVVLLLIFSQTLRWLPSVGLSGPLNLILPTVVLALPFVSVLTRMIRNGLLEVMGEGYINTARAKGLSERIVIFPHAVRNAAIPVVTIVGLQFGSLLGGAVVVETVFAFPGIGDLLVNSIQQRDYNVVQACVLVIAAVFVVINLIVDLLYGFLDPRVRLAK
jgi:ABC-type dipeptide/oligopeptide/nickel transport system permease component